MAYILEADPKLISPEYWHGVDITNPNHLADTPSDSPVADRQSKNLGAEALSACLGKILQTDPFQERSLQVGEAGLQLPEPRLGTVLVLDVEYLSRHTFPSGRNDKPEPVIDLVTPPISEPFTSHWRQQQQYGRKEFGREQAFFEREGVDILYTRALRWGVVTRSKRGTPVLSVWQFDTPRLEDSRLKVPKPEWTEKFPPEIDVPRAIPFINLGRSGIAGVERVRDARVVARPGNGENAREFTFAEQLRFTLASLGLGQQRLQPIRV